MDETQYHSRQRQSPIPSSFRIEYAREWGPCVLGIDQGLRGPTSASVAPPTFCGVIVPCFHEPALECLGLQCCATPSIVSVCEQERLERMIQSDSYIAWLMRTIPSEVADGARCSMGILEHTNASFIIKEAIACGIDIRCIRVSCYSDPVRFRQFLFEAFPMIEDIYVYPRVVIPSSSPTGFLNTRGSPSMGSNRSLYLGSSSTQIPAILSAANVVAQSALSEISRNLVFKQRHFPTPLAPSPLSKSICGGRKKSATTTSLPSLSSSLLGESMLRSRTSFDEDECERTRIRCAPFVGGEFGEAHCGLVSSSLPQQPSSRTESSDSISMYDFYDEDIDEAEMIGLTSPKRIRVVPCSPPLSLGLSSDDSMSCPSTDQKRSHSVDKTSSEHSCSPPCFSSTLFVSPPFSSSCSNTSTSVPVFRDILGMTCPL